MLEIMEHVCKLENPNIIISSVGNWGYCGLNDTDATAETRGTLPLSLKMVRTTTAAVAGDLLLDTYTGAAAAYSVRKLDKDYTGNCMRVREDSGDTEADIGFDGSGDLNTAAIATHCGSANGYVVTWYDQSGNSNNATQSTLASQPQIYNGTAVNTENGKPAISEWTQNNAILIGSFGTTHNDVHVFSVTNDAAGSGVIGYVVSGNTGSNFRLARNISGSDIFLYDGAAAYSSTAQATGQALISSTNETTPTAFFNGSSRSFNNTLNGNGMSGAYIGRHPAISSGGMRGTIQEIIIFSAHQSSTNRTGIETDIDTYFSIT